MSTELTLRLVRYAYFGVALALVGSFFLPWVYLDGFEDPESGVGLITLVISPWAAYLMEIGSWRTFALLGGPAVALLASCCVIHKYARRRRTPLAAFLVLAFSVIAVFGSQELVARPGGLAFGSVAVLALSALLVLHQAALAVQGRLLRAEKLPQVCRALSYATGRAMAPPSGGSGSP